MTTRIAFSLVLAACSTPAAAPPPQVAPATPSAPSSPVAPYAPLFEVGRTWSLPLSVAVTAESDRPARASAGALACKVASVKVVGDARLATVTCTAEGRDLDDAPAGVWIATRDGLYHAALPFAAADLAAATAPARRLLAAAPTAGCASEPGDTGVVQRCTLAFAGGWCTSEGSIGEGDSGGWKLCFRGGAIVAGGWYADAATARDYEFGAKADRAAMAHASDIAPAPEVALEDPFVWTVAGEERARVGHYTAADSSMAFRVKTATQTADLFSTYPMEHTDILADDTGLIVAQRDVVGRTPGGALQQYRRTQLVWHAASRTLSLGKVWTCDESKRADQTCVPPRWAMQN